MRTIRLTFHWMQVIAAALMTLGLGLLPFVRCLIGHYSKIHIICFLPLIMIGLALLRLSIGELREAQKDDFHE